jgi:NAD(P)-dependent dehydrogenase (short-subunit alcohol dehydrogenase family)
MDRNERTALITGSTDGVGRLVAIRLAQTGARVIVHGRDEARGAQVVREIEAAGGTAVFERAELASLADVRRLAERVRWHTDRLHILINNAGIGTAHAGTTRLTSADGIELRFAVNYLAGFLLTRLLLPTVIASAPARIIFVSSLGQSAIDLEDVMLTHGYSGIRAYCQSKLAQIMCGFDLARELDGTGVTVNSIHPATYMNTTMVRESGVSPMSTVEQGAEAILHLAESPELEGTSGQFFNTLKPARAHEQAYRLEDRARLREISMHLARLDP